jgi:putative transposase
MRRSRFSEERIIGVLREHEAEEICRRQGIPGATLDKWKSKYGSLDVWIAGTAPQGT